MGVLTIFLFFVYLWGLGFSLTRFVKESDNSFEKNIMRIGIGLAFFPILAIFLNMIHVPLDWKVFLVISLAYPCFYFFKNIKRFKFKVPSLKLKIRKSTLYVLLVLILFSWTLFMYTSGSFKDPYLENADPWAHANGIKFVSEQKTAYDPNADTQYFYLTYIDPYPPSYDVLMGVLHQTSPYLSWTMKFFNSLIISLGILFFYFFAKLFIGSRRKAVFSTFILTMIPCYLSHFIWAHSLVVTLFFPVMYAFLMMKKDSKWAVISAFGVASIFVIQPTQPFKLALLFFLYLLTTSILEYKFKWKSYAAFIGGIILSMFWWVGVIVRRGFSGLTMTIADTAKASAEATTESLGIFPRFLSALRTMFSPYAGTATRKYTFSDFFIAQKQNLINNPIGVGIIISLLLIISIIVILIKYKKLLQEENHWQLTTMFWFAATFLLVNSATFDLPIGSMAFRVWMLMAIPIALLCAEGFFFISNLLRKYKVPFILILSLFVVGIYFTSGVQKYAVNTSSWPTDIGWVTNSEMQTYLWLKDNLPPNTAVYDFSQRDKAVIGMDKSSCFWCEDVISFRKNLFNSTGQDFYTFLKMNKYKYVLISPSSFKSLSSKFGANLAEPALNSYLDYMQTNTHQFKVAYNTQDSIIFKVI